MCDVWYVQLGIDDLDEIVVSPTMGTDHFVDRMYDEMNELAEEHHHNGAAASMILRHRGEDDIIV